MRDSRRTRYAQGTLRIDLTNWIAVHHDGPALDFEADSVESSLEEMDVAVVGGDDEVAVGPGGIFVSADQKFQGEVFEDEIVCGFKFVIGKRTERWQRFDAPFKKGLTGRSTHDTKLQEADSQLA